MSLRNKVIALLLVLFGGYALVEYGIQRLVLYPSFLELEREEATRNVERAVEALQREVELLGPSASDWARWDDTYRFVDDHNDEYRDANLNAKALESLRVQLLGIYDLTGSRVWGLSIAPDAEGEIDLGALSGPSLPVSHPLMAGAEDRELRSGIVMTAAGPLLAVAHPVLDSNGEGPARGTVVLGRLLDASAISRIAAQARIDLRVEPPTGVSEGEAGVDPAGGTTGTLAHTGIRLAEMPEVTVGATTLDDIQGQPALRAEVRTPRAITERGAETLRFASVSLALAGALTVVLILALLGRTVFGPVSRLTRHAVAIGASDDLSARLRLERKDEVGVLAREFDRMVERLADARQRLLEQSYRSGVAEMASGVLHNIGNAITPLGVKLSNLRAEIGQAPLSEMELARAMVENPETPADQHPEIAHFLDLAGREVEGLLKHAGAELEAVQAQVDNVQMILVDQQRFSRAERVLEPVALAGLVQETVRLLPDRLREEMAVEVDPAVAGVGPVLAARVALQQVLSNLLINAAEAIHEGGRGAGEGRVRIRASEEVLEGVPVVHLQVEDNGAGIPAEHLPRLFERGFSTKSRGSGMGLHWSANTANALGGRIYAESDGPGAGARLHLLLPLAESREAPAERAA